MHLVRKLRPIQISLTTSKQVDVIQCHKVLDVLSFVIRVIHKWETPDVTETNSQGVMIFEVSYVVAEGEFVWKDAARGRI